MPELSFQEIGRISLDISRQEITFSHLLDDLTDHICCDVEAEMQNGFSFTEAYSRVKKRLGSRRLKEIQEETLYAIDTKYRKMKKTMKISGVAGTILMGFAATLKIMHLPLAGALFTLGALLLALVFLPSALTVLWKETRSGRRLFLFITAFLAGSFFILGILFKVQHWPGAGLIITLSLVTGLLLFLPSLLLTKIRETEISAKIPVYITAALGFGMYAAGLFLRINHWPLAGVFATTGALVIFFIVFPWYTWLNWKEEMVISSRFLFMVIASLALVIPVALLNLSIERSYELGFYDNQDRQEALYNYQRERNGVEGMVSQYQVTYRDISDLHRRTGELMAIITDMEAEMVKIAEGSPGNPSQNPPQLINTGVSTRIDYRNLTKPFHPSPAELVMFPGTERRRQLDEAMKNYTGLLTEAAGQDKMEILGPLLEYSSFFPSGQDESDNIALLPALHAITVLKNRILLAEVIAMKILSWSDITE